MASSRGYVTSHISWLGLKYVTSQRTFCGLYVGILTSSLMIIFYLTDFIGFLSFFIYCNIMFILIIYFCASDVRHVVSCNTCYKTRLLTKDPISYSYFSISLLFFLFPQIQLCGFVSHFYTSCFFACVPLILSALLCHHIF